MESLAKQKNTQYNIANIQSINSIKLTCLIFIFVYNGFKTDNLVVNVDTYKCVHAYIQFNRENQRKIKINMKILFEKGRLKREIDME